MWHGLGAIAIIERLLRFTYNPEANAAYVSFRPVAPGEAAETHVMEPSDEEEARAVGDLVLDTTRGGEWLGLEILGATFKLPAALLASD